MYENKRTESEIEGSTVRRKARSLDFATITMILMIEKTAITHTLIKK